MMTERSTSSSHHHHHHHHHHRSSSSSNVSDQSVEERSSRNNINHTPSSSQPALFHYPPEFLLRIPKSDLHIHLDGSIRLSTLIELAQDQNVSLPSYKELELQNLVFPQTYSSLQEYLAGFGYILSVLRNKDALERVSYEVGMDGTMSVYDISRYDLHRNCMRYREYRLRR